MDIHIINYNNYLYSIYITQDKEDNMNLFILDSHNYQQAVVEFEPCGSGRYNYDVLFSKGMDENTIDNLIELFTQQIMVVE